MKGAPLDPFRPCPVLDARDESRSSDGSSEGDADAVRTVAHVHAFTAITLPRLGSTGMYVIYRVVDDRAEPFMPLVDFFVARNALRRLTWQRNHVCSLSLLLEYVAAAPLNTAAGEHPCDLLQGLANALLMGTDHGPRELRGLLWEPRSPSAVNKHLSRVSEFGDWLSSTYGSQSLNPWREATAAERVVYLRRANTQSNHSLLSHAVCVADQWRKASRARTVQVPAVPLYVREPVKVFDDESFALLVTKGLSRKARPGAPLAERYRLTALMICVLMHAGGLRNSEPLHLFVDDVVEDPKQPGSALVWLYHPSLGAAPTENGRRWPDRKTYLAERWGLLPRHLTPGGQHVGWKDLALSDGGQKRAQVYWSTTAWGRVFWKLYQEYKRVRVAGAHPFLFVTERGDHKGSPCTLRAFNNVYRRGVRRAGLKYGKYWGTSAHGHRHWYGLKACEGGAPRHVLQRAMHHRSATSQDAYTEPSAARVNAELDAANRRCGATDFATELLGQLS